MSDATEEDKTSFLVPSERVSSWLFLLSLWGILLWILNLLQMATPTGDKVVWASILSIGVIGGDYLTSNPDFRIFSDGIFIILCVSVSLFSVRGIIAGVDKGIVGWLLKMRDNFWPAIVEFENIRKFVSVWLILIGILFYFFTGLMYNGWVDPGVYSIAAPCVIFGWAFGKLAENELSNS